MKPGKAGRIIDDRIMPTGNGKNIILPSIILSSIILSDLSLPCAVLIAPLRFPGVWFFDCGSAALCSLRSLRLLLFFRGKFISKKRNLRKQKADTDFTDEHGLTKPAIAFGMAFSRKVKLTGLALIRVIRDCFFP